MNENNWLRCNTLIQLTFVQVNYNRQGFYFIKVRGINLIRSFPTPWVSIPLNCQDLSTWHSSQVEWYQQRLIRASFWMANRSRWPMVWRLFHNHVLERRNVVGFTISTASLYQAVPAQWTARDYASLDGRYLQKPPCGVPSLCRRNSSTFLHLYYSEKPNN